jgi:CBS domain-containing protein
VYDVIHAGVDYLTLQLEWLKGETELPTFGKARRGIAIMSDTPVTAFAPYAEWADFVLFMTTTPGQSGGQFNADTFQRIRAFTQLYPGKAVHVDGGITPDVAFVLRTLGVKAVVSGGYLVGNGNHRTVSRALLELRRTWVDSAFPVRSCMIPLEHTPRVQHANLELETLLRTIEEYNLGFACVIDEAGNLVGISTNADIRRGVLRNIRHLGTPKVQYFINTTPAAVAYANDTLATLLKNLRILPFPVLYLPVIEPNGRLVGSLTFNHLIRAEL